MTIETNIRRSGKTYITKLEQEIQQYKQQIDNTIRYMENYIKVEPDNGSPYAVKEEFKYLLSKLKVSEGDNE